MAQITSIIREDAALAADQLAGCLQPLAGGVLVLTGAGGFLCGYLLDVLAALNRHHFAAPCRVLALDNFATGVPDRVAHLGADDGITFLRHDVVEPYRPAEKAGWIVHAASIASPTYYRRMPLETIDVNVTGTRRMLELARQDDVRSMVHLSSSEIYGDPDPSITAIPEDYWGNVSCTGPRACYDESKRLGETLCATYHRLYGTRVKIVRPFNVYGPGQRLDDRRVIPDLMSAALAGRPLVLLSDGRATRSFCYVSDFVAGMLRVLVSTADGEPFNVGNDEEVSITEVARVVAEAASSPPLPVQHHTSADAHYLTDNPRRRCPDLSKLRARTGWQPRVPLREGLARTLASYREEMGTRARQCA
jgi:UDP-glucuronate decarboxylase